MVSRSTCVLWPLAGFSTTWDAKGKSKRMKGIQHQFTPIYLADVDIFFNFTEYTEGEN